jgi:hypothetical protein
MNKSLIAVILMFGTIAHFGRQAAAELDTRYQRITSYELRPGIVMTPEYTHEGQICQMVLERRQRTKSGFLLANTFTQKEVTELVEELVPKAERGNVVPIGLSQGKGPEVYVASGISRWVTTYENISVESVGIADPRPSGIMYAMITWRNRSCSDAQQRGQGEKK